MIRNSHQRFEFSWLNSLLLWTFPRQDKNILNVIINGPLTFELNESYKTDLQATLSNSNLKNTSPELQIVFNQACALEMAQENSESYSAPPPFINAAPGKTNQHQPDKPGQTEK